jgi:2-dehydro-3-deoxygluconokinase
MLLWNRLKKNQLIALLAPKCVEDCFTAYETLDPLGVVLEIALRTPVALDGIRAVREQHPDALLMAGTVLTRHQAECAIDAGVSGIVSADYVPIVVEACARENIMCIPGGLGDVGKQLVQKAELYNCELDELKMYHPYQWNYKLFPAMVGGPSHLKTAAAWRAVYKDLTILYTGGVEEEHIEEILALDPEGIICGSALCRDIDDPEKMRETAERWLARMHGLEEEEVVLEEVEEESAKVLPEPQVPEEIELEPYTEFEEVSEAPEEAGVEEEPELKSQEDLEAGELGVHDGLTPVDDATTIVPLLEESGLRDEEEVRDAATPMVPVGKGEAIVTFGEVMLRLSPPQGQRFGQNTTFDIAYGGAEANVAVALANYGLKSRYISALPDHAMGQSAVNALRSFGVDTAHILRQGKRIGIYYLEHGASQRPSKVIYDRAGSSISEIHPGQVDWKAAFQDAQWFHWSGITPALSDSAAEALLEGLKAAKRAGIIVSVDLNYRSKLWSEVKAQEVLTPLMHYVDVAIGNEEDAEKFFGIRAGDSKVTIGELEIPAYEDVSRELVKRFDLKIAAITLRESLSASDNIWSACLYNGQDFYLSKKYTIHVVDRVGGGDSFTSGLIFGLLSGKGHAEALEFAAAASCLKQTISGDFNLVSTQEVESLAAGSGSGRINR